MEYPVIFGIIALAALIHASFQLSVSMVTLLSGHSMGNKARASRTMQLVVAFFAGTVTMTLLSVSFLAYTASQLFPYEIPRVAWAVTSGLAMGLGITVWAFYYRHRSKGTTLWIPRSMARFLTNRTKSTTYAAESYSLGLASVLSEGIFIIAPASAAALAMIHLPAPLQLAAVALYTTVASLSILLVVVLIGAGHKLSRIQYWREQNKRFLQFAAGSALLILGFYMYTYQVLSIPNLAAGSL
ncbi:hypothetical protein EOL96_01095 [Candidatus Saccharibacteria bacterium]|nr:hypothetical protein [Candidatus Saccharibacteria bacterium]